MPQPKPGTQGEGYGGESSNRANWCRWHRGPYCRASALNNTFVTNQARGDSKSLAPATQNINKLHIKNLQEKSMPFKPDPT